MKETFALAGQTVSKEEIRAWLKHEDDSEFVRCSDKDFLCFLEGWIYQKRGKPETSGAEPEIKASQGMNNNLVLKKIKIALSLKSEDMMSILHLAEVKFSKHELSALFRKHDHKHYRECKDQLMRKFLKGLQLSYRPSSEG